MKSLQAATKADELDKMQARSFEIDKTLSELREQNKEELKKTERRLSR